MFIKYGEYQHLLDLKDKGLIYFNPCKYFRDLESEQQKKGIGDGQDGGISVYCSGGVWEDTRGRKREVSAQLLDLIPDKCLDTPIFCIKKSKSKFVTKEYRKILQDQFSNYTHALIIEDESLFLENLRSHFRNTVFAHKIFYMDNLDYDFLKFIKNGQSDIYFDSPIGDEYYIRFTVMPFCEKHEIIEINSSNFYRSMYQKNAFFKDQEEYRIVLPYERQSEGKCFQIEPFSAQLLEIDKLVLDEDDYS